MLNHGQERESSLSNALISGFGSKAWCAGPERRLAGTAASASESTKSPTIKSLLEKSSRLKLGPWGKRERDALDAPRSMAATVTSRESRSDCAWRGECEGLP
jgi:hypothetical protein